jgi:hypothetical protein
VIAVIETDAENLSRLAHGWLERDGRQGCKQIQTRLFQLNVDSGPTLGTCGNEGQCVRISELREREDVAVLKKCRSSGCIATVANQVHLTIVQRGAEEWVKIMDAGFDRTAPTRQENASAYNGVTGD